MAHAPTRSTRLLTALSGFFLWLLVSLGGFMVFAAVTGSAPTMREVTLNADVEGSRITGLSPRVVARDEVAVEVRIPKPSHDEVRWAAGRNLTYGVVAVAAIWLLRQLLRSVRDRSPFTESNVWRLRALAFVLLVGTPLATFVASLFESAVASSVGVDSGVRIALPGSVFLAALGGFVLAEIFAAGVRMRDDLEGTV